MTEPLPAAPEPTANDVEKSKHDPFPAVRLDDHAPLRSVGLVCVCGRAVTTMENVARSCECGRIWLISAMQIGGPRA